MSESSKHRGSGVPNANAPRAIVHKRILDEAEKRPDAPMEAIAEDVTGANTSLVEKVLDEYGDPAHPEEDEGGELQDQDEEGEMQNDNVETETDGVELRDSDATVSEPAEIQNGDKKVQTDQENPQKQDMTVEREGNLVADGKTDAVASESEPSDAPTNPPMSQTDGELVPNPNSLTSKQLETLREIHRDPEATQAELAERFGVTSATINQRVNSIDGFDWNDRRRLTQLIFRNEESEDDTTSTDEHEPAHGREEDGSNEREEREKTREPEKMASPVEIETDSNALAGSEETVSSTSSKNDVDEEYLAEFESTCEGLTNSITELNDQVERLETRISDTPDVDSSVWIEPELAHKVAHACLQSEQISEKEELRIFNALINPANE